MKSQIRNDTLWVAQEGYGLAAYKLDSLYYKNGYMCKSKILHIFKQFVTDFDFINDTLIVLTSERGDIYNIKPWLNGYSPVKKDSLGKASIERVKTVHTNTGIRVVGGFNNTLSPPEAIMLFDPFTSVSPHQVIDSIQTGSNVYAFTVNNDTLYCGHKFGNKFYLAAYRIYNDNFVLIDTVAAPGEINCITVDKGVIVAGCLDYLVWYNLNGNTLVQKGTYFDWYIRPQGLVLKNHNLYVADKMYGLRVFDISSQSQAVLVAECKGTKGWVNLFGSNTVNVGNDGKIYLADQHAGVIIIESYDTTLSNIGRQVDINKINDIEIFPNPATDNITVIAHQKSEIEILNIEGQIIFKIYSENKETSIDIANLSSGIYIIKVKTDQDVATKKFIKD